MKVLVLPNNYGSMPSITMDALKKQGADVRGLTHQESKYNYRSELMKYRPFVSHERKISRVIPFLKTQATHYLEMKKLLDWCDVIHWTSGFYMSFNLDYKMLKKSGKPGIVEFVGSETRNPEVLKPINKFYKQVYEAGNWEYQQAESAANSRALQLKFKEAGLIPAVCPEMSLFLDQSIWTNKYFLLFQRFNVTDYTPAYPPVDKQKIVISHSPSAKYTKGTYDIERAIANLKGRYEFEYKTYHNVPREKVLEAIRESDIFIDQIIIGSYGTACMEAMSMGKPVVVYIMQEVFDRGLPKDIPVVNANPESIEQRLEELILNAQLRHDLGVKSRRFVEQYHDADKIAVQLLEMYETTIKNR